MDLENKFVLDACCGGRMFWNIKEHPNVVYQDIRKDVMPLKEQYGSNFTVEPDVIGDFRDMKYPDKSFNLVIFDPPHLVINKTTWIAKKYGTLKGTNWKKDIEQGFKECWRVLDNYGILLFKWNDCSIKFSEIKKVFPEEPLIINRMKKKDNYNYWVVFMKLGGGD